MEVVVGGEGAVEVRDTNSSAGQGRTQSERSLSIACESRQVSRNVHWEAKTPAKGKAEQQVRDDFCSGCFSASLCAWRKHSLTFLRPSLPL